MSATTAGVKSTIIPAFRYRNAPAAIDWLCQVFGFERHVVYAGANNTIDHAELTLGGGMIMLGSEKDDENGWRFKTPEDAGFETSTTFIVVEDVDAVYARAVAAGGHIIRELQNTSYGSREFGVTDPDGHSWGVGTYDPWAAQSA